MSTFTLDTLSTFANNAKIYLFIYFTYLFIGFLVLRTHLDVFKMVFYMLIAVFLYVNMTYAFFQFIF